MKKIIEKYSKLGITKGTILGWITAIILSWVIIGMSIAFFITIQTINKHNQDLRQVSERANLLLQETMNVVQDYHTQISQRDFYFLYATQLIENHYENRKVPSSKRMTPQEVSIFLKTIWDIQNTGLYNGITDLYLPLAFAAHETDFIPSAVGKAGEHGLFQFMPYTAQYTAYQMGLGYTENCETEIVTSVYLWYTHYRHLYMQLKDNKEVFDWVSIAYNTGIFTRGLLTCVNSGISVDDYLKKYRDTSYNYHTYIKKYHKMYIEGLSTAKQQYNDRKSVTEE